VICKIAPGSQPAAVDVLIRANHNSASAWVRGTAIGMSLAKGGRYAFTPLHSKNFAEDLFPVWKKKAFLDDHSLVLLVRHGSGSPGRLSGRQVQ
jgi:hypothetical protein